MPVRNIEDKKLRIRLADMDQNDPEVLYELALEIKDSDGEDPEGDARRILREVLMLQPDHAAARLILETLSFQ